jgi:hypothetical protein
MKPSECVSRMGDSASVQAVTRVNAEQALYGAFEVKHIFYTHSPLSSIPVSLFDSESRFFAPTHVLRPTRTGPVKVGHRSSLAARSVVSGPRLDRHEHGGHAGCGRDDDQRGELAIGRDHRATTLYSVGP